VQHKIVIRLYLLRLTAFAVSGCLDPACSDSRRSGTKYGWMALKDGLVQGPGPCGAGLLRKEDVTHMPRGAVAAQRPFRKRSSVRSYAKHTRRPDDF